MTHTFSAKPFVAGRASNSAAEMRPRLSHWLQRSHCPIVGPSWTSDAPIMWRGVKFFLSETPSKLFAVSVTCTTW